MGRPRKLPGELGDIVPKPQRDGRWRARVIIWDATGKRHELESTAKSSEAAEASLRAKVRAVWKSDIHTVTRDSTFEQLARDFLADMEQRPEEGPNHLRDTSKKNYRAWTESLIASYSDVRVHQLTPVYLKRQIDLIRQTKSISASENATKMLSMILNHAIFVGAAESNPISALKNKLVKSVPKKMALTPEQFTEIIRMVRQWRGTNPGRRGGARPNIRMMEDYLVLGLATSARPSEVLAFSLDDVSVDGDSYRLAVQAKIERVSTGNATGPRTKLRRVERLKHDDKKRIVTLPEFAIPTLQRLIREYEGQEQRLLFSTKHGGAYEGTSIVKLFAAFREQHRDVLEAIGISDVDQFVPKVTRKTAATAVAGTAGEYIASKILGHGHVSTSKKNYISPLPEVPIEATNALSAAFTVPEL